MIASLRKRFIIIAMCSVLAVLAVIIGTINISSFAKATKKADVLLDYIAEHDGSFPAYISSPKGSENALGGHRQNREMSAETPFDTRFFSVLLTSEGEVASSNLGNIAAVSQEMADELALDVFEDGSQKGYEDDYRYLSISTDNGGTLVIFLDNSRELSSCNSFLLISLLVSLLGSLAFLVLVLLLSKKVMQPVAESYEKQKRFITDASHELKTPLTVIDASTEVIELESGETQWTRSIRNQVRRLTALTQGLVELSRMGENKNPMVFTEFSLSDAVEESALPFSAPAQTCGKVIKANIEQNLSYKGDEKALRQLVGILLDNAIKYSTGSEIVLSLKKQGKNLILSCKNSAENLEKRSYPEFFDRFYRGDNSRSSTNSGGGYGIGLSLAQAIVQAHRGKIFAKSEDGERLIVTALL